MKQDPRFPNLFILNHPLIQHKLSHMRDKETSTRTFRELLREITLLMGYEITRNLPLTTRRIDTPLVALDAPVIAGKKLTIVPVLRAGDAVLVKGSRSMAMEGLVRELKARLRNLELPPPLQPLQALIF